MEDPARLPPSGISGGTEGCRACFADLQSPRRANAGQHEKGGIVMLALWRWSAAETWVDMALSGRATEPLRHLSLRLPG
jgi:hypothetical protein